MIAAKINNSFQTLAAFSSISPFSRLFRRFLCSVLFSVQIRCKDTKMHFVTVRLCPVCPPLSVFVRLRPIFAGAKIRNSATLLDG